MFELPTLDRNRILTYLLVGAVVLVVGVVLLKGKGGDGREILAAGGGQGAGTAGPKVRSLPLTVDVSGAVARPGVYTLPRGSRVIDAIRRAGGATRAPRDLAHRHGDHYFAGAEAGEVEGAAAGKAAADGDRD